MAGEKEKVCVTGAGGFVASWVVNLLLSKDYVVHGTVRQPGASKYAHLNKLEKASENLKLFKADLLDYDSLRSAVEGCSGVFHVASPAVLSVTDPDQELLEPAVKGTLNVLKACVEAKVKRVVVVSSIAAIVMNPDWPKGQVKDETCWSVPEYMKTTKKWYYLSKTEAESQALEFGKRNELEVVTVCPSVVLGPILQSTLNLSSSLLVATSEAGERYICTSHEIGVEEVVEKYLRPAYPNYNYPNNLTHTEEEKEHLSSEKLQRLGWTFRPVDETLIDSIESYRKAGIVD
ncbi:cinnamoyl-CoA reductase 2 [Prunus yedoensis var. nudiflora]|uniref:Bifunctional dihydroflavonol 4-reductase/flavanone 4-reductase n=1 Tax=Prunus yedoensis var. nudiflora TaxID=2094558 RepID=A0A314UJ55_PRUYE|nr:cinnamoyl-CoA reductase 2 [Prunus yedoensis var. nudiflora]